MQLWKKFLIIGVILSVAGFILIPVSQIRIRFLEVHKEGDGIAVTITKLPVYPFSWLLLPASIILAIGIVSICIGALISARNRYFV